jgi:NAD(P)-dependent dehydrogenase (short-subunit alcohol dehydrogenase family)
VRCNLQRRQSRSVSRFGLIDLVCHAGATSGIGAETARVLAKRGARVVIPARNVKAAEDMRARIRGECPGADVLVLPLDLSSLASVRAFADRFLSLGLPLHLLMYVRHSH